MACLKRCITVTGPESSLPPQYRIACHDYYGAYVVGVMSHVQHLASKG